MIRYGKTNAAYYVYAWMSQIRCVPLLVLSYYNSHDDECYRCADGVQNKTLITHIQ